MIVAAVAADVNPPIFAAITETQTLTLDLRNQHMQLLTKTSQRAQQSDSPPVANDFDDASRSFGGWCQLDVLCLEHQSLTTEIWSRKDLLFKLRISDH